MKSPVLKLIPGLEGELAEIFFPEIWKYCSACPSLDCNLILEPKNLPTEISVILSLDKSYLIYDLAGSFIFLLLILISLSFSGLIK